MTTLDLQLYQLEAGSVVLAASGMVRLQHTGPILVQLQPGAGRRPWERFLLEFAEVSEPLDGWVAARVRLVVSPDHYCQAPVSWYDSPTDLWTGLVRWLGYGGCSWALVVRVP